MSYNTKQYLATALEPLHVGAGGQRLGRVDMTVVREPATNVPYIPGTSLSGALKFFADFSLRDQKVKDFTCASVGGSKEKSVDHVLNKCPICVAFGYTPVNEKDTDESGKKESAQGLLQFSDARLLLSPINTIIGPVWLTTPMRLKDILDLGDAQDSGQDTFSLPTGSSLQLDEALGDRLNFGWILLKKAADSAISVDALSKCGIKEDFAKRVVIVSEHLFSHLVNDSMEIRTSVVINADTGAADDKGLFTFEAVPRGAVFSFNIVEHDYHRRWQKVQFKEAAPLPDALHMIEEYAFDGIRLVGMGGMTTRGFGCLDIQPCTK